jgi:hypothetical protein
MTVDPISSYSSQSLGSDVERDRGQARQLLNAQVSTRIVGVQLGKLGVSLRTQDISFAPKTAPTLAADFAQELELQRLTCNVDPFRPAGATSQNANLQRLGASAYSRQAQQTRSVNPMINVTV